MTDQPTDLEQAHARISELEAENAEHRRRYEREEVARRYGIPPAHAARLRGTTPEELEADAADFAAALPPRFRPYELQQNGSAQ